MKLLVIYTVWLRNVYCPVFLLLFITPHGSMVKYGLLQTWIPVFIGLLRVIFRIFINWQSIYGFITVYQILSRISSSYRIDGSTKTTWCQEKFNFISCPG